ncbi:hypothetical protein E3N88_07177 [Mikania micrantha]|uniref:Uncharacterized protein n=1 Tax=Mikania micrantha TaxID=192012 RepID=A0A5N6PRI4_9ASTR|nr:hypothetical protein E3N88_07177 [Mikania micrantha]
MAVDSTVQDGEAYSVVLSNECELPMDLSSPTTTEVCNPLKSQLSLDARLSNQSNINMMVENAVVYSTFTIDNDVEKGVKSEPQCNEQVLMKSLQKQISFDMGGKYMQLLMNHSLMLSKFSTRDRSATEKILDAPKSRKYKHFYGYSPEVCKIATRHCFVAAPSCTHSGPLTTYAKMILDLTNIRGQQTVPLVIMPPK